jgi:hypothetical protein
MESQDVARGAEKTATILPALCSGTYAVHASNGGVVHIVRAVLADCPAGVGAGTRHLVDRYSISRRGNLPARCPGASAGGAYASCPTAGNARIAVKGGERQGDKLGGLQPMCSYLGGTTLEHPGLLAWPASELRVP